MPELFIVYLINKYWFLPLFGDAASAVCLSLDEDAIDRLPCFFADTYYLRMQARKLIMQADRAKWKCCGVLRRGSDTVDGK